MWLKQIVFFDLELDWNEFFFVDCGGCLYSLLNFLFKLKDIVGHIYV